MDIRIRADMLSTDEFENFAIELAQIQFNKNKLHGFSEGTDEGIDGIDDILCPSIILQAKRWHMDRKQGSAITLLKNEVDKIVKKKEKENWAANFKYVIVTSMNLSPKSLAEIRKYIDEKLPGSMGSDNCIIFGKTLNELASKKAFKEVFEKYELLQPDLSKILHEEKIEAISYESRDYFKDFDMKYFVETDVFEKGYQILRDKHLLLISGPAGSGKTTTTAAIGHIFNNIPNFNVSLICRSIKDISSVIEIYNSEFRNSPDHALLVVLDDFLGHNDLEIGDNDFSEIKKLCSAVSATDNLYVCLNSRTQILQNAKAINTQFHLLFLEKFDQSKSLVVDVSDYSLIEKANILRKNFEKKYSVLTESQKMLLGHKYDELRKEEYYKIVSHNNFSPRLIETVIQNILSMQTNTFDYMLSVLENPQDLYTNLFDKLKKDEQYLLLTLATFQDNCTSKQNLVQAVETIQNDDSFNFEKAFEKLDGSWIKYLKTDIISPYSLIQFYNPSIIDFINFKKKELHLVEKKILAHAIFLEQIMTIESAPHDHFMQELAYNWENYIDKKNFIGEKIYSELKLNNPNLNSTNFIFLLAEYTGDWNLSTKEIGWLKVIQAIQSDGNKKLQLAFIDQLQQRDFTSKIIHIPNMDLDTLNSIGKSISIIINNVNQNSDLPSEFSSFKEMEHYDLFKSKKIDLIQELLDDYDFANETAYDHYYNHYYDDEKGINIDHITEETVYKLLDDPDGIWNDLDIVEFETDSFEYNVSDYLEKENREWPEDDYDFSFNSDRTTDISSVIDKPL